MQINKSGMMYNTEDGRRISKELDACESKRLSKNKIFQAINLMENAYFYVGIILEIYRPSVNEVPGGVLNNPPWNSEEFLNEFFPRIFLSHEFQIRPFIFLEYLHDVICNALIIKACFSISITD